MAAIHRTETSTLATIADNYIDAVRIQAALGDDRNKATVENLWQDFREVLLTEKPDIKKRNVLGKERASAMAKAAILQLDVRVLMCFESHGVPFTSEEFQAEFRFLKKTAREHGHTLSRQMRLFMKNSLRISFAEGPPAAQSAPIARKPCHLEVVSTSLVDAARNPNFPKQELETLWHQFRMIFLNSRFDPRTELLPIPGRIIKRIQHSAVLLQDTVVLNKLMHFGFPGSPREAAPLIVRIKSLRGPHKPSMRTYLESLRHMNELRKK